MGKPLNIGSMSWKSLLEKVPQELLRHVWIYFKDSQIFLVASSLAYTTILSIIPLLAVSFSIFQTFGGLDNLLAKIEPYVVENLARGTGEQAIETIRGFISKIHAGALGATGFVGLFITSMSMLNSAENAINRIWRSEVKRGFFQKVSTYWFFISLGPLSFAILLGSLPSDDLNFKVLPQGVSAALIQFLFFFCIYKWVPTQKVKWMPAAVAAVISTILWKSATYGYEIYTKTVLTYSKIYGSLGAIPILLFWIYICWIIVLTGAAISAAIQNRIEIR